MQFCKANNIALMNNEVLGFKVWNKIPFFCKNLVTYIKENGRYKLFLFSSISRNMMNLILSFLNWNHSSFRVLNILIWYCKSSTWISSLFINFEFHWASKLWVQIHSGFKFLPFFEFKLKFGDEFRYFWPDCFKCFKFYQVWVCFTHKPSSSILMELEIWMLKHVRFSSFKQLIQALILCHCQQLW